MILIWRDVTICARDGARVCSHQTACQLMADRMRWTMRWCLPLSEAEQKEMSQSKSFLSSTPELINTLLHSEGKMLQAYFTSSIIYHSAISVLVRFGFEVCKFGWNGKAWCVDVSHGSVFWENTLGAHADHVTSHRNAFSSTTAYLWRSQRV